MPKGYVVAGAAGFIGSHLVEALLSQGSSVLGIDNYLTGKQENISHLVNSGNFIPINGDISFPEDACFQSARQFLGSKNFKSTYVFNFASAASPLIYQEFQIETLMAGSLGTKNLLDLATETSSRFIQASTSEIYGNPKVHPQVEEYHGDVDPIGPRSMYDEAKRFGEALVTSYVNTRNTNAGIVRIFNTYGPRMREDDGRVIPNFVSQALSNCDVTIYGDGNQTRSMCFVADLVRGIIKFGNSSFRGVLNLGNPEEITMLELAEKIIKVTGSKSKIVHLPMSPGDPERRRPDISRAKKVLSWQPEVTLSQGLDLTIPWYREQLGI